MTTEADIGAMYKKKYYESDKTQCARYVVATKCDHQFVNNTLYPNMMDKAKSIISQYAKK